MSRRRRSTSNEVDSLELGLDMVCNAFGGIIFITLLIAILPHGTPSAPPTSGLPSPQKLIQRTDLAEQVEADTNAIDTLSASLKTLAVVDNTADERARLKRELEAAQASLQNLSSTTDQLRENLKHQQATLDQRRSVQQSLIGMIDKLHAQKPATINESRLPDIRLALKANLFIVLKDNRVLVPTTLANGEFVVNRDDFDVVADKPELIGRFTPRPGRGEDYRTFVAGSALLQQLQQKYPPGEFLISLIVYPDASDAFYPVLNAFAQKTYQHYWTGQALNDCFELYHTQERTNKAL